jgi:hypothetical protein
LYITLQHEIVLKSFIVVGVSTFRAKAILIALTHLNKIEE